MKTWQDVMIEAHGTKWGSKQYESADVFKFAAEIDRLTKQVEMAKEALKFCSYDSAYIGTLKCKVDALKKIRGRARKTLTEMEGA